MDLSRSSRTVAATAALLWLAGCSSVGGERFDAFEGDGSGGALPSPSANDSNAGGGDGRGGDGDGDGDDGAATGGGAGPSGTTGAEPPPPDLPPEPVDEGTTGGDELECDAESPVELFLSPDDSNSMSSAVQAREAVLGNFSSIYAVPVRTWEFMNYYSFEYAAAPAGELAVTATMMAPAEGSDEVEYTLQIGVTSEAMAPEERPPINLTWVLDTSGSMSGHPMDMLKATCRAMASSLREGDTVSIVTWNTTNNIVMGGYTVTGPDDPMVLDEIDELSASGGTDLHAGLVRGYELASMVFDAGRINRIVLVSDGGANAGVTDVDLIAERAGGNDSDGIYMVGVGVGSASTYNDQLMDQVTDAGKGASVFVADQAEAQRVFGDGFVNTLAVAARDVRVKLDLPPGFDIVRFSGEEYSADPTEIEPQHIAPNDTMVFHQKISTCAPEAIDAESSVTITVQYKDALTFEEREVSTTATFDELMGQDAGQLRKGAAIFEYAEALKTYQRASFDDERRAALADAMTALEAADEVLPGDRDLAEIRAVLEAL